MTRMPQTLLGEEAFIERFLPQTNPLNPHAPLDFGEGGCLHETFGEELNAVRQSRPEQVWTLLDSDGELLLISGCHFVDRLGYLICVVPVPKDENYLVMLDNGDRS